MYLSTQVCVYTKSNGERERGRERDGRVKEIMTAVGKLGNKIRKSQRTEYDVLQSLTTRILQLIKASKVLWDLHLL